MPKYECYINAGIILPDVEAKDYMEAREKAYERFQNNKKEYMADLERSIETEVHKKEENY